MNKPGYILLRNLTLPLKKLHQTIEENNERNGSRGNSNAKHHALAWCFVCTI